MHDVVALSIVWNEEFFLRAKEMFFAKWETVQDPNVAHVVSHFKNVWTTARTTNWCRDPLDRTVVSNNNGLESTNNVIKREVTQRALLPILDFLPRFCTWLGHQSVIRDPSPANVNYKKFEDVPTFSTKQWTEAYTWKKDNGKQVFQRNGYYVTVAKGVEGDLTDLRADRYIEQFRTFDFSDYDEYTTISNKITVVKPLNTRAEGYTCTCHDNAKNFVCMHSLGVGIIRGLPVPEHARVMLLGRKRRRGRKPMAAPAWQYQPFELASPIAHVPQNEQDLLGNNEQEGLGLAGLAILGEIV